MKFTVIHIPCSIIKSPYTPLSFMKFSLTLTTCLMLIWPVTSSAWSMISATLILLNTAQKSSR